MKSNKTPVKKPQAKKPAKPPAKPKKGRPPLDLTNQTFGKVTYLKPTGQRSGYHAVWMCRCNVCGKKFLLSTAERKIVENRPTCYHDTEHRPRTLCSRCGLPYRKEHGDGLCGKCRNNDRAFNTEEGRKARRIKMRQFRAERKRKGLCTRCDNPARPGGLLCEDHRRQVSDRERETPRIRRPSK